MTRLALPVLISLSFLAFGCDSDNDNNTDGTADVSGRVTDDNTTARTGGTGSLDAVATVQAVAVRDGSTELLGEVDIQADGSYDLNLSEDAEGETLVIQGLDAEGEVVASTLITSMTGTSDDDDAYIAAPMTVETSIEAEVFLSAALRYGEDEVDSSETRLRIDATVATEVNGSSDADSDIDDLADSLVASFNVEADVWASGGGTLNSDSRRTATASAWAEYDLALDAGSDLPTRWDAAVHAPLDPASPRGQ